MLAAAAPGLRVLWLRELHELYVRLPPAVMQQLHAALPQLEGCHEWEG